MLESDLLSPGRILANVRVSSKKRLLELISKSLAHKNRELDSREIFESLCVRENLGSTNLGNGVAIPHGRISSTEDVEALFLQLTQPLLYDSDADKPVDLVFALIVPEQCTEDHSKLLTSTAKRFRDPELLEQLRNAADSNEIWQLLSSSE